MRFIVRSVWLGLVAASLALISGCSSIPDASVEKVESLEGKGFLVLQVVNNTDRLSHYLSNWTAVNVVNVNDPEKTFSIAAITSGLIGTRIFVGALPPGKYAVFNLHSFAQVGDIQHWLNARVTAAVGSFYIEAGRITELDSLIYQPLPNIPGEAGRPYVVTRGEIGGSLSKYVTDKFPRVSGRVAGQPRLGWETPALSEQLNELTRKIKSQPYADEFVALPDDTGTAILGRLGSFYVRSPDGEYEMFNTGFGVGLGGITRTRNRYLVGGERGLLLRAEVPSGPWEAVNAFRRTEALAWLGSLGGDEVVAVTCEDREYLIYGSADGGDTWTMHTSVEVDRTGSGGRHCISVSAFVDDRRRARIFIEDNEFVFQAGGEFEKIEHRLEFHKLGRQPDGTLVGLGHGWMESSMALVSFDDGKTWNELPRRIHQNDYWAGRTMPVASGKDLFMLASEPVKVHSGTIHTGEAMYLQKGRVHLNARTGEWTKIREFTSECIRLLPVLTDEEALFAFCSDGQVMRSDDGGATWVEEIDVGISGFVDEEDQEEDAPAI